MTGFEVDPLGDCALQERGGKGGKGGGKGGAGKGAKGGGKGGGKGGKGGGGGGGGGGEEVRSDDRDPLVVHLGRRKTLEEAKEWFPGTSEKTRRSLSVVDECEINYPLIEAALEHICRVGGEGAVLVFLPGLQEITKLVTALHGNPRFADQSATLILPLHSSLSTEEQVIFF